MSESNKSTSESKPQQPAPQKPNPAPPTKNFQTGVVFVGDSAEGLTKKGK